MSKAPPEAAQADVQLAGLTANSCLEELENRQNAGQGTWRMEKLLASG